jgi:cyclophilin family peptidyl-prolyl cis-trans isomerase
MNQTTWIIGGGAIVVLVAVLLYAYTGDGIPKTPPLTTTPMDQQSQQNNASNTPEIAVTPVTEPTPVPATPPVVPTSHDTVVLHTSKGDITVKLYTKDVPKTTANFLKLAGEKFYDGVRFHRVIKGFMIQGGDPQSKDDALAARWGTGGPGYQFADEIDTTSPIYQKGYKRGILAMANAGPNTNGSQFFIMHKDYGLPPAYTIFGEVISGLEVVDAIAESPVGESDRPLTPITITSAEVK